MEASFTWNFLIAVSSRFLPMKHQGLHKNIGSCCSTTVLRIDHKILQLGKADGTPRHKISKAAVYTGQEYQFTGMRSYQTVSLTMSTRTKAFVVAAIVGSETAKEAPQMSNK